MRNETFCLNRFISQARVTLSEPRTCHLDGDQTSERWTAIECTPFPGQNRVASGELTQVPQRQIKIFGECFKNAFGPSRVVEDTAFGAPEDYTAGYSNPPIIRDEHSGEDGSTLPYHEVAYPSHILNHLFILDSRIRGQV
jgi:hypothetical protein